MRPVTIIIPNEKVKIIGILHFVHGMQEHRKRYMNTLLYFSKLGYICAISDMRGHGDNVTSPEDLGHFGSRGASGLVDDVHLFNEYLKKIYPGLPIIIVAHSMGTLVAKTYAKKYSNEISAMVLVGAPSKRRGAKVGKVLVRTIALFKGWRYRSPFITKILVGNYDKPFKKEGLKNAWLTRDGDIVDKFNRDPLCGIPFTLNGYKALLNLMISAYSSDSIRKIKTYLPIMYISGSEDSCRISDKKWQDSVAHLKKQGFKNITSKMYPGMRHELFNEIGKEEVFNDINRFLELNLGIEADIY